MSHDLDKHKSIWTCDGCWIQYCVLLPNMLAKGVAANNKPSGLSARRWCVILPYSLHRCLLQVDVGSRENALRKQAADECTYASIHHSWLTTASPSVISFGVCSLCTSLRKSKRSEPVNEGGGLDEQWPRVGFTWSHVERWSVTHLPVSPECAQCRPPADTTPVRHSGHSYRWLEDTNGMHQRSSWLRKAN